MIDVVGVRFKKTGKIYYFDIMDTDVQIGENVIVETIRGLEFGKAITKKQLAEDEIVNELKPVIRVATLEDENKHIENKNKSLEALIICQNKIKEHGLEMKIIGAEYTFDNLKLLFYFTADGRIDFRELVKDLASIFKTRIELRQIGVRDEAKTIGGLGCCGRACCCKSFLTDFAPVSIKMAKDQGISLNPTKISGLCGRLMCCLKYEQDGYECIIKRMPRVGEIVRTKRGKGTVVSQYLIQELVKVLYINEDESTETELVELSELQRTKKINRKLNSLQSDYSFDENLSEEELKALEGE